MEYIIYLVCVLIIFSIASLSMGLMVGYTGIIFVGGAAFMGIGAYTSTLVTQNENMPIWLGVICGMITTMIIGSTISILFRNIRKDYLALATLGVGVILFDVFNNWISLTYGPVGIPNIKPLNLSLLTTLFILISILVIVFMIFSHLEKSNFGCVIRAIRDDEGLLQSLGFFTFHHILLVFNIAFAGLGLAGALFAHYFTYIDPTSFGLSESMAILSMIIIGGIESRSGSLLGVALYLFIPEGLRFLGLPSSLAAQVRHGIFGLSLVLLMVVKPQGILGKYSVK